MCVCSAPARLSNTIVYAGLAYRNGSKVHVMGYQNQSENLATGPNCMLLHIPSAAPMSPKNMVDTSDCPELLADLVKAARPMPRSMGEPEPAPVLHVFESGIYTVVSCRYSAQLAGQALDQVPAAKRPAISDDLLELYDKEFPGWHLALCCFDNRDRSQCTPLLWWYESLLSRCPDGPRRIDSHLPARGASADASARNLYPKARSRHERRLLARCRPVERAPATRSDRCVALAPCGQNPCAGYPAIGTATIFPPR